MLQQITVSGTVGKQTIATTQQAILKGVMLTPSAANATIKIRDGNASGEVVLFARAHMSGGTKDLKMNHKFSKGMHVKVIGTNAEAYLLID